MIRLHVEDDLSPGRGPLRLSDEQAHYLLNVMRLRPGARLALFNGRDGEAEAVLVDATGGRVTLAIGALTRPYAPGPDLDLIVALVRRGPLETIVEKATELGVRRIVLTTTRRTNAERTNVDRLRKIAAEAAEQSGRMDVPGVVAPVKLQRLLDAWDGGRRLA